MASRPTLAVTHNKDSVVMQYQNCVAQAEEFYFRGDWQSTQAHYYRAFELSVKIMQSYRANKISIHRLLQACNDCLDYCPLPDEKDQRFILENAALVLESMYARQTDKRLKAQCLHAYQQIAAMAAELVRYSQNTKAIKLVERYQAYNLRCSKQEC